MRKLAFLASAVLITAVFVRGRGSRTAQPLAPWSVSLSIRHNPPAGVSVLSFKIAVTGATLQPLDGSQPAVALVISPIEVEVPQLETEKALLNVVNAPEGTYRGISLTFANPKLTILNQSGQPIAIGTQTCLNGLVCEFNPPLNQSSITISSAPFPVMVRMSNPIGLEVDFFSSQCHPFTCFLRPTVRIFSSPAERSSVQCLDTRQQRLHEQRTVALARWTDPNHCAWQPRAFLAAKAEDSPCAWQN